MLYTVKIKDSEGVFTRRGYESFREAQDACRFYAAAVVEDVRLGLIYARIYGEDGLIKYDYNDDAQYDTQPFLSALLFHRAA